MSSERVECSQSTTSCSYLGQYDRSGVSQKEIRKTLMTQNSRILIIVMTDYGGQTDRQLGTNSGSCCGNATHERESWEHRIFRIIRIYDARMMILKNCCYCSHDIVDAINWGHKCAREAKTHKSCWDSPSRTTRDLSNNGMSP